MIESQKAVLILFCILLFSSCVENETLNTINLDRDWLFHPDEKNIGITEKWFASDFDDSNWDTLKAGNRWENQGYPNLDGFAWYRKS